MVNISTVGKSAIFAPDGSVIAELEWYEPGAMVEAVPLRTGLTPAMMVGSLPDVLLLLAATALSVWLAVTGSKPARRGSRTRR